MAEGSVSMNRRTAMLAGSLVAAVAAAGIVGLSALLASERSDDRTRYADAIAKQRRAAGSASRAADIAPGRSAVRTTLCVNGVDTLAATIERALHRDVLTADKRLDVAEFRQLSNRAVRAERYVEQASAGPALIQRMGRTRVEQDGETVWQPLEPPRIECDDDDAYARFRLDVSAREPVPATSGG